MRRREFITLIGTATTLPLVARAELRLIGVITPLSADDPGTRARDAAFRQALKELDWIVGSNIRIEYRWSTSDSERRNAVELVGLSPDVILATGSATLEPLLRATHTVPIVFVQVADPVGAGLVESLSRPGGNATGFTTADYTAAGKWLEFLKEIAPNVKHVALLRDANTAAGIGQWGASEAFAGSFGLDLRPVGVSIAAEIERAIELFARDADCGMVVTNSGPAIAHRDLIVTLAARYHLPTVYGQRLFAVAGGLISYGSSAIDPYRHAASYVDRILRGTKPSDLTCAEPDKVRASDQPQDRQVAWANRAAFAPRPRRRGDRVRRREFIAGLGGAAAWPLVARAQSRAAQLSTPRKKPRQQG